MTLNALQQALLDNGYDPGLIDGIRGPKTEKAAKDWLEKKPFTAKQPIIEPPWVTEMMEAFGLHEARDNAALRKWLRSDGKTLGDPAKLPWCGDGMDTALWLALPDEPRPGVLGENPYWALNWGVLGVKCDLCYGAIASFQRQGGGHVGILDGQDATHLRVLGCNQSDSCGFTWIAKSQLKAVRWPSTFSNPNIPLPFKKRDGTPAKSSDLA